MVDSIGQRPTTSLSPTNSTPHREIHGPVTGTDRAPAETARLARWSGSRLGLSAAAFAEATAGGRLSLRADGGPMSTQLGGAGIVTAKGRSIPTTADGVPDVIAMMNAGAEIIGAATGGGEPVVANQSQFGLKAYWAFQVDFHDGDGPQWVKGGTADPGQGASASTRAKVFADLIDTVDRLPNSLLDFLYQAERREGMLFDSKPPLNRIDLLA